MSPRRIAVLVGSHDPAYFARYTRPDRPGEAAVLTALRAQRSASEASHRASAHQTATNHGRRAARRVGARAGTGTRLARVPDSGGPPRIGVLAAAARARRPTRRARARIRTTLTAGA